MLIVNAVLDAGYILVGMGLVQKRLVSDLVVMVWACALYYNDCGYCATMVFGTRGRTALEESLAYQKER